MTKQKTLIVITGPTASGKSALAISLARKLHTEIISADSRQIYRGIPIVTAIPSDEELRAAPHHLIGTLPLEEYYSASRFEEDALRLLEQIWKTNDYAIVCGGSMMYVDTLCNGIDELPTVPDKLRSSLMALHSLKGDEWLLGRLEQIDPEYYAVVDKNNIKRVFHAVEVSLTAGKPYSCLLSGEKKKRDFRILKFALAFPREKLFERINSRVLAMVENGLEQEAARVFPQRRLNSLNTVGLKEMFLLFEGKMTREEAIARIQKNTRVYAKKQLTWFKKDPELHWIDAEKENPLEVIMSRL